MVGGDLGRIPSSFNVDLSQCFSTPTWNNTCSFTGTSLFWLVACHCGSRPQGRISISLFCFQLEQNVSNLVSNLCFQRAVSPSFMGSLEDSPCLVCRRGPPIKRRSFTIKYLRFLGSYKPRIIIHKSKITKRPFQTPRFRSTPTTGEHFWDEVFEFLPWLCPLSISKEGRLLYGLVSFLIRRTSDWFKPLGFQHEQWPFILASAFSLSMPSGFLIDTVTPGLSKLCFGGKGGGSEVKLS